MKYKSFKQFTTTDPCECGGNCGCGKKSVNEKFSFSKKEVEKAANLIASAISQADMVKAKVHHLEYDKGRGAGFDISIDGEESAGGSYVVKDNGDVVNAAIGNSHPNAVYNTIGNKDIADVFINMEKYESLESNLETLLGTSEDESVGRKIRLGGKRDPGQEVWQKVDKKNWMNLKTKKKLDINKWAKHADGFHMSGKDLQFESKVNEASGDLKVGDRGEDYNNNIVEIIAIGRYDKIAKMFKKEMKADPKDYGIEELMVNTDYYLTKNIKTEEGNEGDYYIYPVRYDMANYWGLDELDENLMKNEGMSKSGIRKAIKVIDQQIENEEGGDGEPLDNETLQALEQERERLKGLLNEDVVTEAKKYKFKELAKAWRHVYDEDMEDEYEGFYQEVTGKHKDKVTKSEISTIWTNLYGEDIAADYDGFFNDLKENLEQVAKLEEFNNIEEAKSDGTISDDEDDRLDDLLGDVEMQIDELIQHAKTQAYEIGGNFRGPGMTSQLKKLMLDKLKRMKN